MTLQQAIKILDDYDFKGIEPEALGALGVVIQVAKVKVRSLELDDTFGRVVETTVD